MVITLVDVSLSANWLTDISWVPGIRNDILTPIFKFFTIAGYHQFYMIGLPLLYWLWNKHAALRTALLVAAAGLLNSWLKDYWQDPRPDAIFHMDSGIGDSFGRPSGHVQISAMFWFWLAYEINKKWLWALAVFMVVGIALSRIYLGVHDPDDILTGLGLVIVTLLAAHFIVSKLGAKIITLPAWLTFAVVIAVQFVLFKFWPIERGPGPIIAIGAFFLTWMAGYYIDRKWLRYAPPQGWLKKLIAGVIGVAGIILLSKGLSPVLDAAGLDGTSKIYAFSIILGLYMSAGALWILQTAKLAGKTS